MNWFKYRLPITDRNKETDTSNVVSGASHSLIRGLGEGFAVAPFLNPSDGLLTIPFDFEPSPKDITPAYSIIPSTTLQNDYYDELEAIKTDLNGKRGKTVAARTICIDAHIDIDATFEALCKAYPGAFVFVFSTEETGTWFGATPELLLHIDGKEVTTMALAGTRRISETDIETDWDPKNIDEQKMVEEFICESLSETCGNIESGKTYTKKAGTVEHICTPIQATLEDLNSSSIASILCKLSPTPAVCGSDRTRSLEIIEEYERFDREMYGGFCGPNNINGETAFFVTLRSAKCTPDAICLFAGGGITPLSNPEEEWKETEMKSKTIINQLKFSQK